MYLWIWTPLCVWTCMYPWTFVCELSCEFGLLWTCMYMWTVLCLKLMWCWSVNLLYHVSSSCCVNVEKIVVRNHKACSCMPDCWSWDRSSLCCCNCKQAWNEKWKKARPATKATFSTCQRSQDTIYHPIGRLVSSAKTCWQKKRAASGQIRCLHASAPLHAPSARCMHAPAPRGKNVFLTVT